MSNHKATATWHPDDQPRPLRWWERLWIALLQPPWTIGRRPR